MTGKGDSSFSGDSAANAKNAAELRARLVSALKQSGVFLNHLHEQAFATVPRENFLPPTVPIEKVYSDEAIVVKFNEHGNPVSSSSQPYLMADMLKALRLEPGMRVLEIGAGVGYNAAVMAAIVGDGHLVTTIDIDEEMVQTAQESLLRLGPPYSDVTVMATDGANGYLPNSPYDRIIVTVQQWEISPDWVEQLNVGGLLLLPLTISPYVWGGLIPSLRKEANGTLVSVDGSSGGFMPMRGTMAHPYALRPHFADQTLLKTALPAEIILPPIFQMPEVTLYLTCDSHHLQPWADLLANPDSPLVGTGIFDPGLKAPEREQPREWLLASPAQREIINRVQGYQMLEALALKDFICNLLTAVPASNEPNNPRSPGTLGVRDGQRFDWRGMAIMIPVGDDQALDLAFIFGAEPVRGYRLGRAEQEGNTALAAVEMVWEEWRKAGMPQPAVFTMVAFPPGPTPPGAGYVVERQNYSFWFPISS